MVRKTDPRKTRMNKLRQHGEETEKSKSPSFAQLASEFCQPEIGFAKAMTSPGKILSKEELWNALARSALTLGGEDDAGTRAIGRAFDFFKLDPENPHSWRLLVEFFCYVEFFEKTNGTPGAKRKWHRQRLMELWREIIKWNLQKADATVIAKRLTSNKASSFYEVSFEQVRINVGNLRKGEKELFGSVDV